jgi:pimeloyl-ACP methyl ester carboxylesterase
LKLYLFRILLIVLLVFLLSGCDFFAEDNGDEFTLWHTLSSYHELGTISANEIGDFYPSEVQTFLAYDVTVYRLIYNTETPGGEPVQASGIVLVPQRQNPASIVSLHRSTIFHESEAPSNVNINTPDNTNVIWRNAAPIFGSTGFITVMPDLLGWGRSSEMLHPYMITVSDAVVGFDMLLAAFEMLESEEVSRDDNLFITGYSQGGSSTLALLRSISADSQNRFTVTKASAGGGVYNLERLASTILDQNELAYSPFYAFFLKAYKDYYFPFEPLNRFINNPYDLRIESEQLFSGDYFGDEIEERLINQTNLLINNTFRQQYLSGGQPGFRSVLMDNDLSNFRVDVPLRLYHGENDEIVPYEETAQSFESLLVAGSEDVSLIPIENGTHATAAETFFIETFLWFLGQE